MIRDRFQSGIGHLRPLFTLPGVDLSSTFFAQYNTAKELQPRWRDEAYVRKYTSWPPKLTAAMENLLTLGGKDSGIQRQSQELSEP